MGANEVIYKSCVFEFGGVVFACGLSVPSADNLGKQFEPRTDPTHNRPDHDLNCLFVFFERFFKKKNVLRKISRRQKSMKITQSARPNRY